MGRYINKNTGKEVNIEQNVNDVVLNTQGFIVAQLIRVTEEETLPLYLIREDFDKDYLFEETLTSSEGNTKSTEQTPS